MGKWDEFKSSVSTVVDRIRLTKNSSDGDPPEVPKRGNALVAKVSKVADAVKVNSSQKLDEYFPDPRRREKIGKILSNIGTFAVESAVNESFKGVTGAVTVYKIVKEGLKEEPNSYPRRQGMKKQDLMIAMDEMQAKMEKMQEEVNTLKQQNQVSAVYSRDLVALKESSDEPQKSITSSLQAADKKKVFIRSRL